MANTIEVKVPDIGDFKDIPVIEILVKPGDTVKPEDPLVSLESDKATMDVPAPAGGVVKELKVKVGDKVSEGSLILLLEAAGAAPAARPRKRRLPPLRQPLGRTSSTAPRRGRRRRRVRSGRTPCRGRSRAGQLRRQDRYRMRNAGAGLRPRRLLGRVPLRRPRHEDRAGRALRRRWAACA